MRNFIAAAASAVVFIAAAAQAATFTLTSATVGTLTDDSGEVINIIAAASTERNDQFTLVNGIRSFGSYGIGIQRAGERGSPNHAIDGIGPDEAIIFQAQKASDGSLVAVNWQSIVFGWRYSSRSDFSLWTSLGGYGSLSRILDEQAITVNTPQSLGVVAATIAIQADDKKDAFKLKKLTVDTLPSITNPVPVPGALPLMLAGIAGFTALRRRKA